MFLFTLNIHNSTIRKGLQDLHYQNIYESGTNLWIQLAAPTGVTRLHYIWCQTISCNFTPATISDVGTKFCQKRWIFRGCWLTRCIFVLFFSRSDIREERGHQLDTAQTRRHDTITVTEGGDPTDNYLAPDWPVCDNQDLSLVNNNK